MKTFILLLIAVLGAVITSTAQFSAIVSASGPTTFCLGKSVQLKGSVIPSSQYQYQWLRNGTAVLGANSSSYLAKASGS